MKKNDKKETVFVPISEADEIYKNYQLAIEDDIKYSLEVDPENKYHMGEKQKTFIKYYCEFKNIAYVAQLCGIDEDEAQAMYLSYASQQEIRRINLAMYHRQFTNKALSIDAIDSYLTSILVDDVPTADRLNPKDKLQVVKLMLELKKLKSEGLSDPSIIETVELSNQISDLSVNDIKLILNRQPDKKILDEKDIIIESLNNGNKFSGEEIAYLKTLSLEELKKLEKGGNVNDKIDK